MKKMPYLSAALCATLSATFALANMAYAADNMAGMKMDSTAPTPSDTTTLTDAVVKKVDVSTGMITLQHGALKNVGMSAMTMAYKAKDDVMLKQASEGEKVKVRVENVHGTFTIVRLMC